MAKAMALSHAEVVPVTIYEDADIDLWKSQGDITVRVIRAMIRACHAEPALNSWYDALAIGRRLLKKIDLGMAVDTEDGLFVPVLRDVADRSYNTLRKDVERIKQGIRDRTIPPADLQGATITLSNFGTFAGRYASPIIVPPSVAILATGKIRQAVVPLNGHPVIHWILPLSLSFDHRAVTGGEATRFVGHLVQDLEKSE
jgi:pyruvate dehydrogenase E2 component (dihydrolipoamide acetyltransferase)